LAYPDSARPVIDRQAPSCFRHRAPSENPRLVRGQATPKVTPHDNAQRQRRSDGAREGRRGSTVVARGKQPCCPPWNSPMRIGLRPSISMDAPGGGSHWQGPCPCTPSPAEPTTPQATAHKDATRGLHPLPPCGRHGGSITLAETGKNSCRAPARIVDAGHSPDGGHHRRLRLPSIWSLVRVRDVGLHVPLSASLVDTRSRVPCCCCGARGPVGSCGSSLAKAWGSSVTAGWRHTSTRRPKGPDLSGIQAGIGRVIG
jgi:hypothetical protein